MLYWKGPHYLLTHIMGQWPHVYHRHLLGRELQGDAELLVFGENNSFWRRVNLFCKAVLTP